MNNIVSVLDENQKRNKWRFGKIEKLIAGRNGIIRGAEVKVAEQNKKPTVLMRPLQKLLPLEMNENKIRPSSNPRMEKTNALSKQIQEDENKKDNDVNSDELFPRSPKNLKQSDTEPLIHGDANKNRPSSKCSAAIDADWRRRALNQFDDGDD